MNKKNHGGWYIDCCQFTYTFFKMVAPSTNIGFRIKTVVTYVQAVAMLKNLFRSKTDVPVFSVRSWITHSSQIRRLFRWTFSPQYPESMFRYRIVFIRPLIIFHRIAHTAGEKQNLFFALQHQWNSWLGETCVSCSSGNKNKFHVFYYSKCKPLKRKKQRKLNEMNDMFNVKLNGWCIKTPSHSIIIFIVIYFMMIEMSKFVYHHWEQLIQ